MKFSVLSLSKFSALGIIALTLTACGSATDLLNMKDEDSDRTSQSNENYESDSQNLIDSSVGSASGMVDPQFKPYRLDGLGKPEGGSGRPEGKHADGGGRGHHKGPHGKGGQGKPPHAPLPADIIELFKSADVKKDSVLGIDRTKVEPILKAMATDLTALRSVAGTREVFLAKAKEIQDKYAEQLKAVLPAFDSLTQEQKDRVKAIHDLQKKVIDSCVARGADPASATCTTAKSDLKANIDAP